MPGRPRGLLDDLGMVIVALCTRVQLKKDGCKSNPIPLDFMAAFTVTRAHLKAACDAQNWDLLDKLLEQDASGINDNALYTDTWGSWWGMLLECVAGGHADGVRVLLKHGADKDLASWGDGIPLTPREAAQDKPPILRLINQKDPVTYTRRSDPDLPTEETARDAAVNRQGAIRDATGLVFPIDDREP